MRRRRSRNKNKDIIMLSMALAAIIGIAILAVTLTRDKTEEVSLLMHHPNIDMRTTAIKKGWFDTEEVKKNDADKFTYAIGKKLTYDKWDEETKINAVNPEKNQYLMVVEISLDSTQEVIFRSGYIAPGTELISAPLDYEIKRGKYEATAYISVIDPETEELLGILNQPMNITIKK